jgi:tetratricopeptide (TPR) repeat protein/transcriptional regulator with XRE-family HTH domain
VTDTGAHSLGAELRSLRRAAGLSQEELAERTGLSVRAIGDLERGRTLRPQRETKRRLREALAQLAAGPDWLAGEPAGSSAEPVVPRQLPAEQPDGPVVPRQLPAAVRNFVGRADELARLSDLVAAVAAHAVVITAIGGTAGVGKTALAVQWAHKVSDRFPDGQLYVNLRGYDPADPMAPADALAGFLRALGLPGADIPADLGERAARYRSLLAARRMLIVLDNASSAEQVRPLLPGAAGCHAVVTSRDSLAGLVARDGAQRLELDRLPAADAVQILRVLVGERVDDDPAAAVTLAGQCSCLPLALRVAAELAVARPGAPIADLVAELAHQQLELLDAGGDDRTAIRAVFSWSRRNLDAEAARAFGLLGLHPGPDHDGYGAAALLGTTLARAGPLLDQLARAHLIQPTGAGRYGMHDLLRAYARELADPDDGRAAMSRLIRYYLSSAATAMDTVLPASKGLRPAVDPQPTGLPPLAEPAAARRWLDEHRAAIVPLIGYATDHGWPDDAIRLAATVFRYLEGGGYYPEVVTAYGHALRAARLTGDRVAEAEALNNLTVVDLRQGRYEDAISNLGQALELYRACDDVPGQGKVLGNLGIAAHLQGRYRQAIRYQRQALDCYRRAGDRIGAARTANNLGLIELRLGRYALAERYFARSLAIASDLGHPTSIGYATVNLGAVALRLGRYEQAANWLRRSQAIFNELGDPTGQACVRTSFGALGHRQGRPAEAAQEYLQAIDLSRKTGDRAGEAEALNGLGEVLLAVDDLRGARARHAAALVLATQIDDKYEQARAHDGLGRSLGASDRDAADDHWRRALALFSDLGTPEASQVRVRLASAGGAARQRRAPDRDGG